MDRTLIATRYNHIVDTGLPLEVRYHSALEDSDVWDEGKDYRTLTVCRAQAWQKLKFSEWGVEKGYDESILVKLSDFPTGVDPDASFDIEEPDGWYSRHVLEVSPDASRTGAVVHLGNKWKT